MTLTNEITVPVSDWNVSGGRIPLGYVGDSNVEKVIFSFDDELPPAVYTIEIRSRRLTGIELLTVEDKALVFNVSADILVHSGSVDLQIVATAEGKTIRHTNIFAGYVYGSIQADGKVPEAEISLFQQALLEYNSKLQQAITAAETAQTSADESAESAQQAQTSAEDAKLSEQLADTYKTLANTAVVHASEYAGRAEDAAEAAEQSADKSVQAVADAGEYAAIAKDHMVAAEVAKAEAVQQALIAKDKAEDSIIAASKSKNYADQTEIDAQQAAEARDKAKSAEAGAIMAANTADASHKDAEQSALSASRSAEQAVTSASSAAGSASAAENSAATAEAKASEASASATQAETAKTSTENLLSDAREGLQAKLDKPVDIPSVGSLARVKEVNDDGTFVMEWVEDKQDKIESDLAWESGRVDDAYEIMEGVGYDKVELSGEAYSVAVPEKAAGKAEVTEIGGKTVVWNQLVRNAYVNFVFDRRLSIQSGDVWYNYIATYTNAAPVIGHVYMMSASVDFIVEDITTVNFAFGLGDGGLKISPEKPRDVVVAPCVGSSVRISVFSNSNITVALPIHDLCLVDLTKLFGAGNEPTSTNDPRIKMIEQYAAEHPEYNEGELISAMIDEIASVRPDETVIESHLVPDAVKSLPGYGWSAGTAKNYIYRYNGRWMCRQEVSSVDLGTISLIYEHAESSKSIRMFVANTGGIPMRASYNVLCADYITGAYSDLKNSDVVVNNKSYNQLIFSTAKYNTVSEFKDSINGVILYYELAEPIITDITDMLPADFGVLNIEAGGSITFSNDAMLEVPYKVGVMEKRKAVRDTIINGSSIVDENGDAVIPIATDSILGVGRASASYGLMITNGGYYYAQNKNIDAYKLGGNGVFISKGTLENIKGDLLKRAISAPISDTDPAWSEEDQALARARLGLRKEWTLVDSQKIQESLGYSKVLSGEFTELVINTVTTSTASPLMYCYIYCMTNSGKEIGIRYLPEIYNNGTRKVRIRFSTKEGIPVLYWTRGTNDEYGASTLNNSVLTSNTVDMFRIDCKAITRIVFPVVGNGTGSGTINIYAR